MELTLNNCPNCHGALRELILHSGLHYSRVECAECGRFIRWGRSPSSLAKQQILEHKINWLAARTSLTEWEASFITSVTQQLDNKRNLSPKQTEWLERLYQKYAKNSKTLT